MAETKEVTNRLVEKIDKIETKQDREIEHVREEVNEGLREQEKEI